MDIRFVSHNAHLENAAIFAELDPQLRRLKTQRYIYQSPILENLPKTKPGIYSLSGGRQIGKTTLLKQWMAKLLSENINPQNIAFFTGELIDDFHVLLRLMENQLATMPQNNLKFLLIDEITYIKDWDKAIKFAADAGILDNVILLLTGSDIALIKEARMRFPGRRGKADIVDFHLYPISFYEFIKLKNALSAKQIETINSDKNNVKILFTEFNNYLQHGGYLTAINDLAINNNISNATLTTYSDWVRGDMLKRGKNERYLSEILAAIIKRYNTQITWHSLAKDLSIDSHVTVADYLELLQSLDVIFIQQALLEDKLIPAPKKARKVMFTDPFIFHAIRSWLWPQQNAYQQQILPAITDPVLSSGLVEACVSTHYARLFPTYYIKADGEVDIAYVTRNRFWPIEIKWANQIRQQDIKQILKYKNGRILSKTTEQKTIGEASIEPLPIALFDLK